ncbi:MAG: leucine-rich repeat protein [Oscillospiraceae bacterium]|nr:leucine-rich repeat protein [Oscillospiraceae bacterium]
MKFCKIISGVVCMAFAVSSASVLGNVVADAVNLENLVTMNTTATLGLGYEVYEDHVEITDCNVSAEGEIIIPDTILGLPVTSIKRYAFSGCSSVTSIIIPNSITNIGDHAFNRCSSLTSITIPDSVTSIQSSAFKSCAALESIIIPENVTSVGSEAFWGCSSLKSIIIPNSVTSIGFNAFSDCYALESITIPDSVTSIAPWTFYDCDSLTSVTIPNSVTSIGNTAFWSCPSLETIIIPDSVKSIGSDAFCYCTALKSIKIPDGIPIIGDRTFYRCFALESITIPESVTSIGEQAFYDCSSLESITILNADCEINGDFFNGNADSTISKTAVIYGYPDSTAQAYAEKYNRKFVALDGNQDTTDSEIDPEILWGDADGNGKIEILDVVLMNRVYVGVDKISESGKTNADTDQDSKITLSDSMNVLKLLVHLLEQEDFPIVAES